jgi:CBS domain containing-hemolysin-like protein
MTPGVFEPGWLAVAFVLFLAAMYVAVARQVLAVFSRRKLFEAAPPEKHARINEFLEHEGEYTASLRSLDHLLRVSLALSLAFGRVMATAARWPGMSFGGAVLECLLLAGELLVIFVLFLEILPGIVARVHPEARLLRRLRVIPAIHVLLSPVRSVTARLVRFGVSLLGGKIDRPSADILEEEILNAAEEGERGGLLGSRDIDMIESIITFGNLQVSEVMTPRTEMVCLDVDDPLEVSLKRAIECGHSRIPVFKDSKDNVIGLLYVKDLLRYWDRKEAIKLQEVVRKPHFVPVTKKIGELFQEFKTQRFHIAIILDEFGGTSGLVTIEDIIEEIVGEITDEYEKTDRPRFKRVAPELVEVMGSVHIDELNAELGLDLPEGEAYDTLAGFLSSRMGKIPSVGDGFDLDSVRFEVTSADDRRVRRVRIRVPPKPAGAPDAEAAKIETKAIETKAT